MQQLNIFRPQTAQNNIKHQYMHTTLVYNLNIWWNSEEYLLRKMTFISHNLKEFANASWLYWKETQSKSGSNGLSIWVRRDRQTHESVIETNILEKNQEPTGGSYLQKLYSIWTIKCEMLSQTKLTMMI